MTETAPPHPFDSPPAPVPSARQALTAFLRGIERRGMVFADLQSGDPVLAEHGYAVALRVFRDTARQQSFAQWPVLFWRALLSSAPLRTGARAPMWTEDFAPLGTLGSGPRAALLLRLVAGLPEADAAGVLGIARPTYRLALQRALPHCEDGSPDQDALRRLHAAAQAEIRTLPAERLAHMARLREAAAQGRRPELIGPLYVAPAQPEERRPHVALRGLLWGGVALCVLALAASFLWPALLTGGSGDGDADIRVRPLGSAARPAARYGEAFSLLTERDFELLAEADRTAMPDDPAFFAWHAAELARRDAGEDPDDGMRDPMPATPGGTHPPVEHLPDDPSTLESTDVPL